MDWLVIPEALYEAVRWVSNRYPVKKTYIAENGAAYKDTVTEDGEIHDSRRIEFLRRYIDQVHRAVEDGFPVKGYFLWTLMDNFEWCFGFSKRFGAVYVDYDNDNERIPKDSYYYYRNRIAIAQQESMKLEAPAGLIST